MAKVAVIGLGTIGAHVAKHASSRGHEVVLIATCRKVTDGQGKILSEHEKGVSVEKMTRTVMRHILSQGVDAAMLAIPSGGSGLAEAGYIFALTSHGIGVVTAGKSALANKFDILRPCMKDIRYNAAVGGGVEMPSFFKTYLAQDVTRHFRATAIVNATLNFAQYCVRQGLSPEHTCDWALKLGFAEPSENGEPLDPLALYQGEIPDISRKLAIICNTQMFSWVGRTVSQADFKPSAFTEDDLWRVMAGNSEYAYMVRLCTRERDLEFFSEIKIGGQILTKVGNLWVAGGFVKLKGWIREKFMLPLAGNAIHLMQSGDPNYADGQGAGAVPTSCAMFMDLEDLLKSRK